MYYPKLFGDVFEVSEQTLSKLCTAGYLYYISVLLLDDLIDNENLSNVSLVATCQEESIKLLSSIFPVESDFWVLWNQRKNEYFYAIKLEKKIGKKEIVSFSEYAVLADYKAAIGKVAIDCLFSLDKRKDKAQYNALLASHKHFSVAYQLNDDILDFVDDYKNEQFNWLFYKNQASFENDKYAIEDFKKILYIDGKVSSLFEKAIFHLIEEELFFIIHFETQLTMTRLFYVSSFVASFFSVLYFLCKGLHWPYANTFMQISFVTILLFVLPSIIYLASRNRKAMTGMDKARVTIGVLAGFLTSVGMIFKGLHFPGGGIMFVIGCFIIGFVFLPMFFFQLYQRSLQLSK